MSNKETLNPGRELDALIAEKVFGINVVKSERKDGYAYYTDGEPNWDWIRFEGSTLLNAIPNYSTDISAAWEIVEHLRLKGVYFEIHPSKDDYSITGYDGYNASRESNCDATAKTFPHAICLAALKAIES